MVDQLLRREPPAAKAGDMFVHPGTGDIMVDFGITLSGECIERAARIGHLRGEHGLIGGIGIIVRHRCRQIITKAPGELGENPPARLAVTDGFHHARRILRAHPRADEIPQRNVGALELVLGRQDMGR